MKKFYTIAIFLTLSVVMHGAFAQAPAQQATAAAPAPAAKPAPLPVEVTPKAPSNPQDALQGQLEAQKAETAMANEKNDNTQGQLIQQEAQGAMAPIQADFNAQERIVTGWIAAVKKANGWGDDVTYNRDTKKFMQTLPAPK